MVHKVLWTGGFDSTFRLCQLSREKCVIEPYYIISSTRESVPFELRAHKNILDYFSHRKIKAIIRPVTYIPLQAISISNDVNDAFNRIAEYFCARKSYALIPQYRWLASYALFNSGLEVCHEKSMSANSFFSHLLNDKLFFVKDDSGNVIVDKLRSDIDLVTLFGNFYFPIISFDNVYMLKMLRWWGMIDILQYIRFCDGPDEKPCGVCSPCVSKLKFGLFNQFFDKTALKRFYIFCLLERADIDNVFPFCLYPDMLKLSYFYYVRKHYESMKKMYLFDLSLYDYMLFFFKQLDSKSYRFIKKFYDSSQSVLSLMDKKYIDTHIRENFFVFKDGDSFSKDITRKLF